MSNDKDGRFFIDHGMIHDLLTGRHVTTSSDEEVWNGDTISKTLELLNSLSRQKGFEWLPIETAPKDGSWVFVFGDRFADEELPPYGYSKWVASEDEMWEYVDNNTMKRVLKDSSHWDNESGISPTHWSPLPPAPHKEG